MGGGTGGTGGGIEASLPGAAVAASSTYHDAVRGRVRPSTWLPESISADGYSIQMGVDSDLHGGLWSYDNPGAFVPQAESVSTSHDWRAHHRNLPRFAALLGWRQAVTSINIWDGQTIMLGGFDCRDNYEGKGQSARAG